MKNIIHYLLLITGFVVIFIGIVVTLKYGSIATSDVFEEVSRKYSFSIFLPYAITGIVLIGLSEVVRLLQILIIHFVGIPEKVKPDTENLVYNKENGEISVSDKEEIKEFYTEQSILIDNILRTKLEDFYIVMRGDEKDLIELGGFRPVLVSQERIEHSATLKELLE